MDTANKVYTPEIITDQPFPSLQQASTNSSQSVNQTTQTYGPATVTENPFPSPQPAQVLVSTKLNTVTKKILGGFTFTPSGALRIGDFTQGQFGETDISPAGIQTINVNGDTTFNVDGETGDVTLKGTLEAGSIIGANGTVVIEESLAGNGRIVLYNGGIPSIIIGDL